MAMAMVKYCVLGHDHDDYIRPQWESNECCCVFIKQLKRDRVRAKMRYQTIMCFKNYKDAFQYEFAQQTFSKSCWTTRHL